MTNEFVYRLSFVWIHKQIGEEGRTERTIGAHFFITRALNNRGQSIKGAFVSEKKYFNLFFFWQTIRANSECFGNITNNLVMFANIANKLVRVDHKYKHHSSYRFAWSSTSAMVLTTLKIHRDIYTVKNITKVGGFDSGINHRGPPNNTR